MRSPADPARSPIARWNSYNRKSKSLSQSNSVSNAGIPTLRISAPSSVRACTASRIGRSTPASSPTSETFSIRPTRTPSRPTTDASGPRARPAGHRGQQHSRVVHRTGDRAGRVQRAGTCERSRDIDSSVGGAAPTTPQTLAGSGSSHRCPSRSQPGSACGYRRRRTSGRTARRVVAVPRLRMSPKVSLRPVTSAANSARLFLPRNTAPAARSLPTTAASAFAVAAHTRERDPASYAHPRRRKGP